VVACSLSRAVIGQQHQHHAMNNMWTPSVHPTSTFALKRHSGGFVPSLTAITNRQQLFATYDAPASSSNNKKNKQDNKGKQAYEDYINENPQVLKKQSFWIFAAAGW